MTQYDFDRRPDRLKTHAVKWQATEKDSDLLPLWIADMDFYIAPEIKEAMATYINNDDFGYAYPSNQLYQAIIDWEKQQHGYEIEAEELVLVSGVVPAVSIALQALTQVGDAVLINAPYYGPIPRTINLLDRKLIKNSLVEVDGLFQLDFEQMEADFIAHDVKVYVLCNPQNPGGRVWRRDELERIGQLCIKHGVLLISDEIHQDLTLFGHQHTSFNTVDERFKTFSITLSSATKTFNLAGTKNSFAVIHNEKIRKAFIRQRLTNNQHEIPTLGLVATEAAYRYGGAWLQALKVVLERHVDYVITRLHQATKIKVMKPQATYLLWLDFSAYALSEEVLQQKIREEAKLYLNPGTDFGSDGKQHARLNVAAPFSIIEEACARLIHVFGEGK